MSQRILVLNIVGLNKTLLESGYMPNLKNWASKNSCKTINSAFPAVTCTAQANMLTGCHPSEHGAVANGWYFKDLSEVWLWRQSCHLIKTPKPNIFERWKKKYPDSSVHQLFWWWNLPSFADFSITPRPTYFSDGRKEPDIHCWPPKLHDKLSRQLGTFPLFEFWGPAANINSTQWIIDATIQQLNDYEDGLFLSYLPHLDYDLQRFGPKSKEAETACLELDKRLKPLLDKEKNIVILSEYGIEEVNDNIAPNQILNKAGFLSIHHAKNGSLLDPGNSKAFAVCDHQVAHIYIKNSNDTTAIFDLFKDLPQVDSISLKKDLPNLNHSRAGDLILTANKGCWFNYYYWLEAQPKPDFARCVDIHRKPGFDPCELFIDPSIRAPKIKIASKVLAKKIGMRYLMDVIPIDPSLVKGSHGRVFKDKAKCPIIIAPEELMPTGEAVESTQVFENIC
jgi:predicted AlkP superfamily pyrophosphatase or phosphodiesterase